jgi:hypothetical protein
MGIVFLWGPTGAIEALFEKGDARDIVGRGQLYRIFR